MGEAELSPTRKEELRKTENYKVTLQKLDVLFQNKGRERVVTASGFESVAYTPGKFDFFLENSKEFYERWQDAEEISTILRGLKSQIAYQSEKVKSMSKLMAYLGLVESLGVTLTDIVLVMFIANGTEIHTRGPFTKHVRTFEELRDVDLSYKLDFLKEEGLNLFKSFLNREDRNLIAHLKFKIEENGGIRKLDDSPIHIDEDIAKFWEGVDTLKLVLEDIGFLNWLRQKVEGGALPK
jgi:hypothetical protein